MSTDAIREFFLPLEKWLKKQNQAAGVKVGWEHDDSKVMCSDETPTTTTTTTLPGQSCQTDDHCQEGKTCVRGGICGKCSANEDCEEKLVCLASVLENGETNGKCANCRENQDCGDVLSCLASKECGRCSDADPCPNGQKCFEGRGDAVYGKCVECIENSDCPAGKICLATYKCGECTTDDQCEGSKACVDGKCRNSGSGGTGACCGNRSPTFYFNFYRQRQTPQTKLSDLHCNCI